MKRKRDIQWTPEEWAQGWGKAFLRAMREDDWLGRHERVKDLLGSGNEHLRAIGSFLTYHLGPDEFLYSRMEVSKVKRNEVIVLPDFEDL